MYFKLAIGNVKKSVKDYAIYFLTLVFGVCVFYAFNSIENQSLMRALSDTQAEILSSLNVIISFVSVVIAVILGFLIVYANRYLIRRRTKEFGIYLTLGMERGQVGRIIVLETLLIGAVSLGVGLVLGILLSQGLSLVAAKMFDADLTKFSFVFSTGALLKTLIYFGICFLVVMVFSVFSVMRLKLIDLINADKKVEPVTVRSLWISVPTFILSIGLIGWSYVTLNKSGLLFIGGGFWLATALVVSGTFLFFFSLSGIALRVFQSWKGAYLRGLNMFTARQLSSKINTAWISVSLICVLIFLATSIFSGGMALAEGQNTGLDEATKYDFVSVKFGADRDGTEDEAFLVDPESGRIGGAFDVTKEYAEKVPAFEKTVAKSTQVDEFFEKDVSNRTLFPNGLIDPKDGTELLSANDKKMDVLLGIVPLSQFNAALELQGEEPISLKEDEYVLSINPNSPRVARSFDEFAQTGTSLVVGGKSLQPALDHSLKYSVTPAVGGAESIVVNDDVVKGMTVDHHDQILLAQYKGGVDAQELPKAIKKAYDNQEARPYDYTETAEDIRANSIGSTVIISYLAIYMGFILLITCAAVLALQQLSEASDNTNRYALLSKLGVSSSMSSRALLTQVGIYFFMPLGLALVHSFVALREVEKLAIKNVGMSLAGQMLFLCAIVLAIYLVYFLVTYTSARTIVRTKPAR